MVISLTVTVKLNHICSAMLIFIGDNVDIVATQDKRKKEPEMNKIMIHWKTND